MQWIEDEDERGFAIWRRYVSYSSWGLFLTQTRPRWLSPIQWEATAHNVRVT